MTPLMSSISCLLRKKREMEEVKFAMGSKISFFKTKESKKVLENKILIEACLGRDLEAMKERIFKCQMIICVPKISKG